MGSDRERAGRMAGSKAGASGGSRSLGRFGVRPAGTASYAAVPNVGRVLDAVAFAGDALTCGRTSDGGACSITLLHDREQTRDWAHSQEELNDKFAELERAYLPVRRADGTAGVG